MTSATSRSVPAATFLVHYFGRGLVDEGRCYAVERFKALTNGDILRWPTAAAAGGKPRCRAGPEVATYEEVREMRPAYNEVIVCTGVVFLFISS